MANGITDQGVGQRPHASCNLADQAAGSGLAGRLWVAAGDSSSSQVVAIPMQVQRVFVDLDAPVTTWLQ
ncbi:hypothetical protein D3C81_1579110 [compost metagenome]